MYSFSSMPYKFFMIHANPVSMKTFLINTDINSCQTLPRIYLNQICWEIQNKVQRK